MKPSEVKEMWKDVDLSKANVPKGELWVINIDEGGKIKKQVRVI